MFIFIIAISLLQIPDEAIYDKNSVYHTTKNVGIHLLPVCHLRPTTALSADEQSDTHAKYC